MIEFDASIQLVSYADHTINAVTLARLFLYPDNDDDNDY